MELEITLKVFSNPQHVKYSISLDILGLVVIGIHQELLDLIKL